MKIDIIAILKFLGINYQPTQCMRCKFCLKSHEVEFLQYQNEDYQKLYTGFDCENCNQKDCIFMSDYGGKGKSQPAQKAADKFRYYTEYKGQIKIVSYDGIIQEC